MAVPPFDTLTATRSLERTGVPRAQAESIVHTVQRSMAACAANLVTKDDLAASQAATEASIDLLCTDMNTLYTQTGASIDTLRTTTEASMDNLRTKTEASMDNLRAKTEASIDNLRTEVKAMQATMATKADLTAMKAELFRALWVQSLALATIMLTGIGVLLTLLLRML